MGREIPYLLEVEESSGESSFITRHLIKAADAQMVKYHYHRTLKSYGYTDTQYGKHTLEMWDQGLTSEIVGIQELGYVEFEILDQYLHHWTKE